MRFRFWFGFGISVELVHGPPQVAAGKEEEGVDGAVDGALDQRKLLVGEVVEDVVPQPDVGVARAAHAKS